jgi:hypothetical protein
MGCIVCSSFVVYIYIYMYIYYKINNCTDLRNSVFYLKFCVHVLVLLFIRVLLVLNNISHSTVFINTFIQVSVSVIVIS